ncbi:SH3 domain-containing protein [Sphingobacterium sp. UME9]|uniref:SH3 domain-containing protein n=1 Tax=Sphingobacterium sp. UME9 TaxID=1862316 RepID=UPI0015FEC643|nr:SH3 domain-containing protein [Sphingobacterium sp. UME9]MBB1644967.1 hypothetical protein [Sphingobacterium sp. UME9]
MIKAITLILTATLTSHFASAQTTKSTLAFVEHEVGRCTGSANCTACRNCSKCAHCNSGGTCGVCDLDMHKKSAPKIEKKNQSVKTPPKTSDNGTSGNQDYYLKTVVLNVEKMDLRKGPAADFPILATIYRNQKLTCLSNIGNWAKVKTDKGLVGFIKSDAIRLSNN